MEGKLVLCSGYLLYILLLFGWSMVDHCFWCRLDIRRHRCFWTHSCFGGPQRVLLCRNSFWTFLLSCQMGSVMQGMFTLQNICRCHCTYSSLCLGRMFFDHINLKFHVFCCFVLLVVSVPFCTLKWFLHLGLNFFLVRCHTLVFMYVSWWFLIQYMSSGSLMVGTWGYTQSYQCIPTSPIASQVCSWKSCKC